MKSEWTITSTLAWTEDYLARHAISDARLEAELLLAHTLMIPRLELMMRGEEPVSDDDLARFKECILQRKQRIPLSYITGEQKFIDLTLSVDRHTLIPRPETELLTEEALRRISAVERPVIIDIGTGSGCIGLSMANARPDAVVYCTDISIDALRVAWANTVRHGLCGRVRMLLGSLFDPLTGECIENKADLIISNPPYIPTGELNGLQPELGYEPVTALDGGSDGLIFYKNIAAGAARFLKPGGLLMFELNETLAPAIKAEAEQNGFACEPLIKDYAGLDRILTARKGFAHG